MRDAVEKLMGDAVAECLLDARAACGVLAVDEPTLAIVSSFADPDEWSGRGIIGGGLALDRMPH